jgi:hypothetical protein
MNQLIDQKLRSHGGAGYSIKNLLETTTEAFKEGSLAKKGGVNLESASALGIYQE